MVIIKTCYLVAKGIIIIECFLENQISFMLAFIINFQIIHFNFVEQVINIHITNFNFGIKVTIVIYSFILTFSYFPWFVYLD